MIRLCPRCGRDIVYTHKRSFKRAAKANSVCESCCHTYLTAEQREKNKSPEGVSRRHLKSRYGITLEEKQTMFSKQNGMCANNACRRHFASLSVAHLDHDHETERVRGLLCTQCNMALGLLQDDPTVIGGLMEYMEAHSVASSQPIVASSQLIGKLDGRGKWLRGTTSVQ